MTIPEAAQLVLQASSMGKGGDVYVLDMGEPVKIVDLARKMIELSGNLRPGEKLYEELLIGDNVSWTSHPRIMTATESCLELEYLSTALEVMRKHVMTETEPQL